MDQDFADQKANITNEKDRLKVTRKDIKKSKKTLINENIAINEECKNQREKIDKITKDQTEISDAVECLKLELEELDEQLLRINLKINQATNERVRIEEEVKKYTKVGKQPKVKSS